MAVDKLLIPQRDFSGGQINAGGVNIPDTITAGASKAYLSISASSYRAAA